MKLNPLSVRLKLTMEIKEYVLQEKERIKAEVASMSEAPVLSIITVGHNPASESYVRGKKKDSAEVGITAIQTQFEEDVTEEEVLSLIRKQNADPSITGILVQLPVPKHISEEHINNTIAPEKDVDGFVLGSKYICCTPKGIVDYLAADGFDFTGKNAVVLGRSDIVGKPMARLLLGKNCNVTVLHSKTKEEDRRMYLKNADLIVVAIGRQAFIDHTYELKPTAWLVDVGINKGEDGHLHGDAEPNLPIAKQTPVPGGVGLLTRLALLKNLMEAKKH